MYARPTRRPHIRCEYSMYQMNLNSANVMSWFNLGEKGSQKVRRRKHPPDFYFSMECRDILKLDRSALFLISDLRIALDWRFRAGSSLNITESNIKKWWNLIILTCLNKQKTEWTLREVGLIFYNTYILNSGNCWYFWNSASHSSWLVGGFISFIKCQSTIERPDSVNLREGEKFERESE